MYCPEHLVLKSSFVWVWMYWRDVPRETIPLSVWLNPLNYEVSVYLFGRRICINPHGRWVRTMAWLAKEKVKALLRAASQREGGGT